MALNLITYTDKETLNEQPSIADKNKVTNDDMNEIKSVVNTNATKVGDLTDLDTTDKSSIVNAINEIEAGNVYSTTEEIIGTWFDKPLYRKCFYYSGFLTFSNNTFTLNHGINNFKSCAKIFGTLYDNVNNDWDNLPFVTYTNANIMLFTDATQIKVQQSAYGSGRLKELYVVLEYTKTTD